MENTFSKSEVENFVALAEVMRRIHVRLVAEGVISSDEGIASQSQKENITIKKVKSHGKRIS